MDVQSEIEHMELLRSELARSEAERARAESRCERLQKALSDRLRAETELQLELAQQIAAREDAQGTVRLAVAELSALRGIWTHTQTRLDAERELRFASHAELERLRRDVTELESVRAERDQMHAQLTQVTSSRVWVLTRPVRVAMRVLRGLRSRLVG